MGRVPRPKYGLEELRAAGLTERQIEVYRLVVLEGRSVSEAAEMLSVSKPCVSAHLKRAFKKLRKYEEMRKAAREELMEEIKRLRRDVDEFRKLALWALFEALSLKFGSKRM